MIRFRIVGVEKRWRILLLVVAGLLFVACVVHQTTIIGQDLNLRLLKYLLHVDLTLELAAIPVALLGLPLVVLAVGAARPPGIIELPCAVRAIVLAGPRRLSH